MNPNVEKKDKKDLSKLLWINKKLSFRIIINDVIVPPKAIYKTMLLDLKGHLGSK